MEEPLATTVIAVSAAVILSIAWAAWYGKDFVFFESLRATNPPQFSRIKWTGRINGPLVILMSAMVIVSIPFSAHDIGILPTLVLCVMFLLTLWLSARWAWWSWTKA